MAAVLWALLRNAGGQRTLEFTLAPGSLDAITAVTLAVFGALALLAVLAAVGALPLPHLSTATIVGLAALTLYALVAWSSEGWSLSPFQTRMETLHTATYLGAVVLGALLVRVPRRPWLILAGTVAGVAGVEVVWAVVARSFAGTSQVYARLAGPTDHANALAMAAAILMLIGAAGILDAGLRAQLAGGATTAVAATVLAATVSRAGVVCGLSGLILFCLLADDRRLLRLAPVAFIVPFLALGGWISTWPALDSSGLGNVKAAGFQLLAAVIGAALVGSTLAPLAARLPLRIETPHGEHLLAIVSGSAVVIAVAGFLIAEGGPHGALNKLGSEFSSSGQGSGASRLTSISSDARTAYWSQAWDAFTREPWRGWGAGTFDQLNRIQGTLANPSPVSTSAHNTLLQALAETGIVGGAAMLVAGVALLAGALGQPLRLRGKGARDRRLAAAVACGCVVFFVHGLTDLDWDVTSQGVLVCLAVGGLGTRGLAERAGLTLSGRLVGATCAILALAIAAAAVPPLLAANRAAEAQSLISAPSSAAECTRAVELARQAALYMPSMASPLTVEGLADYQRRDTSGGAAAFAKATSIEPGNYSIPRLLALGLQAAGRPNTEVYTALWRTYQLSGFRPEFKPPATLPTPVYLDLCG